ncbi:MAG: hypothetical protein J0L82_14030 [Deltaproteobacteria bacterium]|nr:hypothetical protein [Deltaproteobacteria bacterium]
MERTGFRFSSKMRNRYWRGLFSSAFLFVMFLIPLIAKLRKNSPADEALFFFVLILVTISCAVSLFVILLTRLYRDKFVLEFTTTELIDRRFLRITRVPYADIEIFSPTLDQIFRPDPALREIRNELEIGDYLMITCRLKEVGTAAGPAIKNCEYFFSEAVAIPDLADRRLERAIRSGLEGRGVKFENLYEIDNEQESD